MPQPRKYESNAARQKAYRERLKAKERALKLDPARAVSDRVMAADRRAS